MMPLRATGIQDENDGYSHSFSYKRSNSDLSLNSYICFGNKSICCRNGLNNHIFIFHTILLWPDQNLGSCNCSSGIIHKDQDEALADGVYMVETIARGRRIISA